MGECVSARTGPKLSYALPKFLDAREAGRFAYLSSREDSTAVTLDDGQRCCRRAAQLRSCSYFPADRLAHTVPGSATRGPPKLGYPRVRAHSRGSFSLYLLRRASYEADR